MKHYLTAILALLLLFPAGAAAQWYLFPGARPGGSQNDTLVFNSAKAEVDRSGEAIKDEDEALQAYSEKTPGLTRVALILPIKSDTTPNANFLDFYCGVLTALDGMSSADCRYELDVYDSALGLPAAEKLERSDLIIGPVSYDDMSGLLPRVRGKFLISPLDPKVAALTASRNVIQAPSGWESQVDELVLWLQEDLRGGDAVILLQSAEEAGGEITERLALKLGEYGINYSISPAPLNEEESAAIEGSCRYVITSENDVFCTSSVREIALMNLRGARNSVYSTSRLRTSSELEVESLHASLAHITASYYADPGSLPVISFDRRYRELFKGEPGQWSYQGYDLMQYFGTLVLKHPDDWMECLTENPWTGLQTDFRFPAGSRANAAVRRLRYNANNTISIIR